MYDFFARYLSKIFFHRIMYTLNNGNQFPLIGFGTYLIKGTENVKRAVDLALEAGYRSFDTACVYWNEEDIGNALIELLPKYNLQRSDIYITSKLSPSDQGKGKAKKAAIRSMQKLKVSYLDLYLIHWPGVEGVNVKSDTNRVLRGESWADLVELYNEGKLKNIGVSNYTPKHLHELLQDCNGVKPAVNQVEYHPMQQQRDLLKLCRSEHILVQAYCSLGGFGKTYVLLEDPTVVYVAKRVNQSPAKVLLKWALQNGVAIIPKSTTPERIHDNINLDFELNEENMRMLDSINKIEKFSWDPNTVT